MPGRCIIRGVEPSSMPGFTFGGPPPAPPPEPYGTRTWSFDAPGDGMAGGPLSALFFGAGICRATEQGTGAGTYPLKGCGLCRAQRAYQPRAPPPVARSPRSGDGSR